MNWEYASGLLLSILIFAPGILVLVSALVVGVLMTVEKARMIVEKNRSLAAHGELVDTAAPEALPRIGEKEPVSLSPR